MTESLYVISCNIALHYVAGSVQAAPFSYQTVLDYSGGHDWRQVRNSIVAVFTPNNTEGTRTQLEIIRKLPLDDFYTKFK